MGFRHRDAEDRVVFVERSESSGLGWFVLGAALGAGLGILFAPRSGAETRKDLGRRFDDLKERAEESLEELSEGIADGKERVRARIERWVDGSRDAVGEEKPASAREELERRLTEARSRRRRPELEEEEPVA